MSQKIYRAELMEHFKSQDYRGKITDPDFQAQDGNPSCGDKLEVSGRLSDGVISEVKFDGSGCVISVATASMLAEQVTNQSVKAVLDISSDMLIDQIGISLGPTRMRCMLLSLSVLHNALKNHKK